MAEAEQLLKDPARLTAEYQRRLTEACHPPAGRDSSAAALAAQIAKLRRGVGRLIDSYAEGTIEKAEFEPRVRSLKERVARLEEQHQALIDGAALQATLSLIIGRLEDFARTVQSRLAELDWTGKRELIRTLVKRVEIGLEEVNVVFRVAPVAAGPQPTGSGTDPGLGSHSLQDCRGRGKAAFGQIARQREINSLAEGSVVLPPGMLEFVSKSSTSKEEVQSGKMNGIGANRVIPVNGGNAMASAAERLLDDGVRKRTSTTKTQVQELVAKARVAQAIFEQFSQEQVDAIVKGIGKYVFDNAEMLARMAVDETGLGVYEDKILKKQGKARAIWNNLKGKKSRGIIKEDTGANMVLVAKPMGVVGAVTPITNPVVTPMCNAMFALKTGNAVIFAPHPKAEKCTQHLAEAFMEVVKANGGPDNLVQTIRKGSVETTQELMKDVDVVVATGGGAMVKSAYSSGKPSYGVGAGNVPVIIDRDVDLKDAAEKIVIGAAFDNGIICSHEQFVLVPEERYDETIQSFIATGKVWFTADKDEVQKIRDLVLPRGHLNKDVVGKSASAIGAMVGLDVPATARIILVPAEGAGTEDVLAREKLCPVVAILPYGTFEEAVAKAKANLLVEGAGHSAALHSHNETNIRYTGLELPISRLVVNQSSSLTAGGSLTNGFAPTTTLGCGSWGGNSISENLDYKHLMNVSRIGQIITGRKVPTDAEIWA